MHEVDDELRDIKREIIESRGLVIKTNNLTNALSADVKSIAKRQGGYERRITWNSATSYVVFVLVVFVCVKFAWDARVDAIRAETDQKTSENDRMRREAREVEKRDEDRGRAEQKAALFYELVRQGKRVELVEGWESMRKEPLTKAEQAMFGDAVERAKNELAASSYTLGLDKARVQRWAEAAAAFEESLKYKDTSPITPNVRLGLADAYRHLGRPRDAIPILTALAETSGTDHEVQDDALHELALCQTDIEAWNEAKNTWRALVRRYPDSHFTPEAKLQLLQLQAMH